MKLILTEKPSVAKDIANAIGINEKTDGIYQNNEYFIINAFGHLLKINDDLIPKPWSFEYLPLFPKEFKYSHPEESHSKQFKLIKRFLNLSKSVIIATDAEREGELIARLILNHAGWKHWSETYRFWTSEALTKEVVLKSLSNLKPSKEYDSLYYSALTRQHTDWLIGINLTHAFTLQANSGEVWSIGRVQSPIIKIINDRDNLKLNFIPVKYFVLKALFNYENINYEGIFFNENNIVLEKEENEEDNVDTKLNKTVSEKIINDLFDTQIGNIDSVLKKNNSEAPPLLHCLSSLQREANEVFGFTAQQTLDLAQELYEKHKCLSYPRTSSQVLAESSKSLVEEILNKLNKSEYVKEITNVGLRVFNDKKLSDHHALIPLNTLPDGLDKNLENLYSLVFRKFIGAFMQNYEYETTEVITNVKNHKFKSNGKINNNLGWKKLYNSENKNTLPNLSIGTKVIKSRLDIVEKYTKPLPHYNESSLLQTMVKYNLGTEATRASIIEVIIKRNYVIREKKNLITTKKGNELILKSNDLKYTNYQLTELLEEQLEKIVKENKGEQGYIKFIEFIKKYVTEEIVQIKNIKIDIKRQASPKSILYAKKIASKLKLKLDNLDNEYIKNFIEKNKLETLELGNCLCGKPIKESLKAFNCECGKTVWKSIYNKKVTPKQAQELLNGKSILLKGCNGASGKFDKVIKFDTDGKVK